MFLYISMRNVRLSDVRTSYGRSKILQMYKNLAWFRSLFRVAERSIELACLPQCPCISSLPQSPCISSQFILEIKTTQPQKSKILMYIMFILLDTNPNY